MTDSNNASPKRVATLLPSDFSNEMFERNMAYLSDKQPALFDLVKKHKCKEYWLCGNADGSPNIMHLPSNAPVYAASNITEIIEPINRQIGRLFCYAHINKTFLNDEDPWWQKNNPIQIKMLGGLYDAGVFNDFQLKNDNMAPIANYSTDYLPFVRVYGIGLGYHLIELIKRKKISYMTIFEPNLDLFYTSLYTIAWDLIFKYFSYNNKDINLVLGASVEDAIRTNLDFIEQRLTPLTSLFYRFNHFNGAPVIQELIEKEPQFDNAHRCSVDEGWYEDQRIGFYYSARNIKNGNKFYFGKKVKRYFRAFIIGSGPSLDESIDYIKAHQDEAFIVSCGSAITPLLKFGIVPDCQVVQERNWHIRELEERHDLDILKNISLLKLNVVSTKIDRHFKEALVFQKLSDPGSVLLQDNYPVTSDVNPTVANAGIAFAAELGVNEAYLFGVDFGAPKGSKEMHALNTFHKDLGHDEEVESQACYDLPGNLGSVIRSSRVLSWSLDVAEKRIVAHPNIQWFNVGEGALIKGVTSIAVEQLPVNFTKKIQKSKLREEMSSCFDSNYSYSEVLARLDSYCMKQVEEYLQAVLEFTNTEPKSREEIVSTLSLMYKAASIGRAEIDFLPASLVAHSVKQFINNVYIQTGLAKDDESAVCFFDAAKIIFYNHVHDIKEDLCKIISYMEKDEETELIVKWF